MLSEAKKKLVKSLHTKKGREKAGLCLVEGAKVIETAGEAVEWTFTREDAQDYGKLVTTQTPQDVAGVAKIPEHSKEDIESRDTVLVLDGVQDPGNVGAILRLCLGFKASLVLVESADVTNPKVVRSSVGAMFSVPWMNVPRGEAVEFIGALGRPVYRLEMEGEGPNAIEEGPVVIIAGSEGSGISLDVKGTSITIPHDESLESLNVGNAVAIILGVRQ